MIPRLNSARSETMRVNLQPAYILHSRPYRDSSVLLEVLTAEQGRISLVARGARRKTRGGSGGALLQPFIPLLLSFSGRTELKNLNATEAAGRPFALPGERLFSGLYLNELLVRLLHRHDPHPHLFAAYGATLGALARDDEIDDVLRRFEFALLGELGYGFELNLDGASGEAVLPECWYHYHPDHGLIAGDGAADPARPARGERAGPSSAWIPAYAVPEVVPRSSGRAATRRTSQKRSSTRAMTASKRERQPCYVRL